MWHGPGRLTSRAYDRRPGIVRRRRGSIQAVRTSASVVGMAPLLRATYEEAVPCPTTPEPGSASMVIASTTDAMVREIAARGGRLRGQVSETHSSFRSFRR
jgi:hypothetical protein